VRDHERQHREHEKSLTKKKGDTDEGPSQSHETERSQFRDQSDTQ
jgi:hypothetical protein